MKKDHTRKRFNVYECCLELQLKSNMQVFENVTILRLHGNAIAYRYNDPERTLSITNCGWFSNTTKERLNGIPSVSIKRKTSIGT
jgi:hypothetical protein